MKFMTTLGVLASVTLLIVSAILPAGAAEPPKENSKPEAAPATRPAVPGAPAAQGVPSLSLKWDGPIPLAVQSAPVEWKGMTWHLVRLGSIEFKLDKEAGALTADIRCATTTFDQVTYDVSAAVLDASGNLLGTARSPCKVERLWLGKTLQSPLTIHLDFGTSLDYAKAATFAVGVSHRKVLMPDDWQKK